jgi:hypothetical protein
LPGIIGLDDIGDNIEVSISTGASVNSLHFLKRNGLFDSFEELLERRKLWDIGKHDLNSLGSNSSFSDNDEYLSIVKLASESDEVFNVFRANRQYRKILEHVTKELGNQYLDAVRGIDTNFKDLFKTVSAVDNLGGPLKYRFFSLGRVSPTTIRYVFVHLKLRELFGSLENREVLEIGGGFGGQAAVSTYLTPNLVWSIYDLPEVTHLQNKFMRMLNPKAAISYLSGTKIIENSGDLLISNYALSEVSRKLQLEYFSKVIRNCPMGFMAWNLISERSGDGLSIKEVLDLIPNSLAIDEYPLTDSGNKFIVWGHSQNLLN